MKIEFDDNYFMSKAIDEAKIALSKGEVPVGAVIVADNKIIARAHNMVEALNDVTAHAEILVIREAAYKLNSPRLNNHYLFVTLEPCPMCAAAISLARLDRLYIGAYDTKGGGVFHGPRIFDQPNCHHRPEVSGGYLESQSKSLLRDFFRKRR